jgi:hypothetical protein
MNKFRIFQYSLLALILSPLVGASIYGTGKAIAQSINASSQFSANGQKITINSPPNDVISGPTNLTGTGNVVVNSQGSGSVGVDVRGSGSGMTFNFQGSVDGTNYVAAPCVVPSTGAIVTGGSANGTWTCQAAGYQLMRVNMSAFTSGTASITLNASAGSNQPPIGTQGTATNLTAVNGSAISGGATGQLPVNLLPVTAGGLTVYHVQPTASDNHANIKNGAGQVYKISVTGNATQTTVQYLRLYNAASGFNGCNSATNIIYSNAIPFSTNGAGLVDAWPEGMPFSTGISICVTGGYGDNDTTNATASAMNVNIGYK